MTAPILLECTLRDGSYVIDFQFTAEDTAIIAAGLESAGIEFIEIGHGLGLNASAAGRGDAAASDVEYMKAAAGALTRAAWGMFCIPGIATVDHLDEAAAHGMRFVRIGTNATEVDQARPYIERAKRLNLFVSANLMKSYAMSPEKLGEQATRVAAYGCDLVALVDSAGTMLPAEVRAYMETLTAVVTVPIGFHGHNNLSLAMANTLTALECGASWVDCTLQGMGRSGGNAATEALVAVLKRQGHLGEMNLNRLLDLSDRTVRPMLRNKGIHPLDLTAGYAGFHSSYLQTVLEFAKRYEVDARDLMIAVCEVDRSAAPDSLVEMLARKLHGERDAGSGAATFTPPTTRSAPAPRTVDEPLGDAIRRIAFETRAIAVKSGKHSAINIVAAPVPGRRPIVSPFIQEEFGFVIGSAELGRAEDVATVVSAIDGTVDYCLVDGDVKAYLDRPLSDAAAPVTTRLLVYKDSDVWVRAVAHQIDALWATAAERAVTVAGADSSALKLALLLAERGFAIVLTGDTAGRLRAGADAVQRLAAGPVDVRPEDDPLVAAAAARWFVPFGQGREIVDVSLVEAMAPGTVVFVAEVGSVIGDAIVSGLNRDIRFVRPDMRAALAAELAAVAGARRLATELMGKSVVEGVDIVAGGLIGRRGDVVVDSISRPTRVVGVADGQGGVVYQPPPEFATRLARVEAYVWHHRTTLG